MQSDRSVPFLLREMLTWSVAEGVTVTFERAGDGASRPGFAACSLIRHSLVDGAMGTPPRLAACIKERHETYLSVDLISLA